MTQDASDNRSLRQKLRQKLRQARRSLSPLAQRQAARSLARNLLNARLWYRTDRIALYLAQDGEIDLAILAKKLAARGKHLLLPVLHPTLHNRLWFARMQPGEKLIANRFGIPEPKVRAQACIAPWAIGLVFLPLVGFDAQGNRLGMGGGFYDRTFAFTRRSRLAPKLIGVAHGFQQLEWIPSESWDIPLAAIATERKLLTIDRGNRQ